MTLPPLPPIELPFIRKEPPPAPAPDASAMERILGPAPALPVALPTPIGTPARVLRAGAPDSTLPKSSFRATLSRPGVSPTVTKAPGDP